MLYVYAMMVFRINGKSKYEEINVLSFRCIFGYR